MSFIKLLPKVLQVAAILLTAVAQLVITLVTQFFQLLTSMFINRASSAQKGIPMSFTTRPPRPVLLLPSMDRVRCRPDPSSKTVPCSRATLLSVLARFGR